MSDLRQRLQRAADYYIKSMPADHPNRQQHEFVLAHGQYFKSRPLPSDFERGKRKKCYSNAVQLTTLEPTLFYAEGFAGNVELRDFPHAWCVDKDGNVYDPTLVNPEDFQFFGVRFSSEAVRYLIEEEWRYYGPVIDFLARNPGRLTEFI
jgi:hypothetical protein